MTRARKLLFALAAGLFAAAIAMLGIEIWVRSSWDETRGRPGFFIADASRGQRLAPNYDGWFAGVPVHINAMGFRDRREYSLAKPPGTFRILVLGDSVTFGHGTLDDTTYPFLLEQELRKWRPAVNWEVWNLGVPGYNTAQELKYLEEIGPRAQPDLVVVGFFPNDFTGDNDPRSSPGLARRMATTALGLAQRHLYSFEFYKRVLLTLRFNLMTSKDDRLRLEHLATEEQLLQRGAGANDPVQRLTPLDRIDDPNAASFVCPGLGAPAPAGATLSDQLRQRAPEYADWFKAVEAFQSLNASGSYRIVFFINMAPVVCESQDRFVDNGSTRDDDALQEVLGRGTPVASVTRAFFHYRPSQVPAAGGHSIGNANVVKARALADFLEHHVLPPLVPAAAAP